MSEQESQREEQGVEVPQGHEPRAADNPQEFAREVEADPSHNPPQDTEIGRTQGG